MEPEEVCPASLPHDVEEFDSHETLGLTDCFQVDTAYDDWGQCSGSKLQLRLNANAHNWSNYSDAGSWESMDARLFGKLVPQACQECLSWASVSSVRYQLLTQYETPGERTHHRRQRRHVSVSSTAIS